MDPLRLGFRSIVGITMPGAIVVLSVLYGLWASHSSLSVMPWAAS
jgi:hypothetical protein